MTGPSPKNGPRLELQVLCEKIRVSQIRGRSLLILLIFQTAVSIAALGYIDLVVTPSSLLGHAPHCSFVPCVNGDGGEANQACQSLEDDHK